MSPRPRLSALIVSALGVIGVAAWAAAQGTPSPRPGLTAQQTRQAVDIARESLVELRKKTEGAAKPDVDRREFTMVRIETDRKNANGKTIGYDLMPIRMGSARHNEDFTQHDFWVTRSHPERPLEYIFSNLANLVKDEEEVESADIVLWATSSSHHEPRDEDGKPDSAPKLWPGDDAWEGSALVMWSGFDLRPRNFFDRTPFYPYPPATPAANPNRNLELRQETTAGAQPRD